MKSSLFFSRIRVPYTHGLLNKIDGSFYSSIESNGLVEIQEYIYTKSFGLIRNGLK